MYETSLVNLSRQGAYVLPEEGGRVRQGGGGLVEGQNVNISFSGHNNIFILVSLLPFFFLFLTLSNGFACCNSSSSSSTSFSSLHVTS